ncbi:MAG: polysaccharide deacetylase family protein [Acidimicrobiales bacterium]|nr:polysaccharide deacetylase family protein [Acidimicrobiales bacterium]
MTTTLLRRSFFRRAAKAVAHAGDQVRPPKRGLVILAYHRVGGRTPVEVDLPTGLFEEQMAALARTKSVLRLDDAVARLARGEDLTGRVVVTFDDGTADFESDALPVLECYHLPATLYVATDFVDQNRPFPDDGKPLSWAALADCVATGLVDVGSHTHTHVLLDRVTTAEAIDELERSIDLINTNLQLDADHFAYPKAVAPSAPVEEVVRDRFVTAALAGTRPNPAGRTDLHRLSRSPVQVADGMRYFEQKVSGGMRLEDDLRRLLNRRRYAGLRR